MLIINIDQYSLIEQSLMKLLTVLLESINIPFAKFNCSMMYALFTMCGMQCVVYAVHVTVL